MCHMRYSFPNFSPRKLGNLHHTHCSFLMSCRIFQGTRKDTRKKYKQQELNFCFFQILLHYLFLVENIRRGTRETILIRFCITLIAALMACRTVAGRVEKAIRTLIKTLRESIIFILFNIHLLFQNIDIYLVQVKYGWPLTGRTVLVACALAASAFVMAFQAASRIIEKSKRTNIEALWILISNFRFRFKVLFFF